MWGKGYNFTTQQKESESKTFAQKNMNMVVTIAFFIDQS